MHMSIRSQLPNPCIRNLPACGRGAQWPSPLGQTLACPVAGQAEQSAFGCTHGPLLPFVLAALPRFPGCCCTLARRHRQAVALSRAFLALSHRDHTRNRFVGCGWDSVNQFSMKSRFIFYFLIRYSVNLSTFYRNRNCWIYKPRFTFFISIWKHF